MPRGRDILIDSALRFLGTAAFPTLAYRLRWPSRLGGRGVMAYVGFNALFAFALHAWVLPLLTRKHEQFERDRAEIARRFGREPTRHELRELYRRS